MNAILELLIKEHFHATKSDINVHAGIYAVRMKRRNCGVESSTIINMSTEFVGNKYVVHIENPELVIVVEVSRTFAA
eukprot:7101213-Ditylum_brightwellii.AAC.1